jgi:hypothetical protein
MAHAGSRGKGKGWRQCGSPVGLEQRMLGAAERRAGGSGLCRERSYIGVVVRAQVRWSSGGGGGVLLGLFSSSSSSLSRV